VYGFFAIARALAHQLLTPFPLLLLYLARRSARADVSGALRFGLKMVSEKTILTTMQMMGRQYWEFMTYETELVEPRCLRVKVNGAPLILRNALLLLGAEYNAEVLRITGSKDATFQSGSFTSTDVNPNPRTLGVATYFLRF
jgi:hypothetical protein